MHQIKRADMYRVFYLQQIGALYGIVHYAISTRRSWRMDWISNRAKLFRYNNLSDSDSRKHNIFASMDLSGNAFHLVTYCVQQNNEVHTHTGCTPDSIGYFLTQEFVSKWLSCLCNWSQDIEHGRSYLQHITTLALDIISPELIRAVYDTVKPNCNGKVDMIFHNSGYRSLAVATEVSYTESLECWQPTSRAWLNWIACLQTWSFNQKEQLSLQAASWVLCPSQPTQFTVQQRLLWISICGNSGLSCAHTMWILY
jgi:hypothetical protein